MFPVGLSFQQAPPFSVPFRFFVTAPLFLFAASLLLIFGDTSLLTNRHGPAALAATHLITLGFITMVMCGALLQLFPVISGILPAHPVLVAWLIHLPLTLGAAGLSGAFLWNLPGLMYLSMACLAVSFGSLLLTLATNLWRAPVRDPSLSATRTALVALAITVCLGLLLGMARHIPLSGSYQGLADVHPLWGLYGWVTLLIMGMAYRLVPMFQLTAAYPTILTKWLVCVLLLCMAVRSLATWLPASMESGLARWMDASLALGALVFALVTLLLQWRRKRKVSDVTLIFWQIGMGALFLAGILGLLLQMGDGTHAETWRMTLGILVLFGFAGAIINGMLYKIVPFLTWFHLQSAYPRLKLVPNVRQIQSGFHAQSQMALFLVALMALIASCWIPILSRIAGMLWAINALWLERNLMQAGRMFLSVQRVARTSGPD